MSSYRGKRGKLQRQFFPSLCVDKPGVCGVRKEVACVASVSVGFWGKELIPFRFRSLVFLCSPVPRKCLLCRLGRRGASGLITSMLRCIQCIWIYVFVSFSFPCRWNSTNQIFKLSVKLGRSNTSKFCVFKRRTSAIRKRLINSATEE